MRIRHFIILFSWRFANRTKLHQKVYMKKDHCIGNPSTEFCNSWHKEKLDYQLRLCDILIRENVRKLFQLEEDFGRVIKKLK